MVYKKFTLSEKRLFLGSFFGIVLSSIVIAGSEYNFDDFPFSHHFKKGYHISPGDGERSNYNNADFKYKPTWKKKKNHHSGGKWRNQDRDSLNPNDRSIERSARKMIDEGRETFRFETFENEDFWGGVLRLHEAIIGEDLGGVGPGVSPETALGVGLKVDEDRLPRRVKRKIKNGSLDLGSPGTTVDLLRLDAVLGVKGVFDRNQKKLQAIGLTCALCHSTVDNSFAEGIGRRLDGWANRDINPGLIISLAPNLSPFEDALNCVDTETVRAVLTSWGPGKFDGSLLLDGQAFQPNGDSAATLIPPIFGMAGVNLHTWTGWGSVAHWNALVATLELGGKGVFYDPRLADEERFPIAAANGFDNIRNDPDLVTPKLPALHVYQISIPPPKAPRNSFDRRAARRGKKLFSGKADCARCHVPPIYTEPGWNLHTPEEIGIDSFQAERGPEDAYRTSPLRGLWSHTTGGFYHDGRFADLSEVINHYDNTFSLELNPSEKLDLTEFLKSL